MIKIPQIAKASVLLFLSALGLFSYMQLPVELLPAFEEKKIVLSIQTEQTNPKENIEIILRKITESLQNISGISSINADSEYNHTLAIIDIDNNVDINYITPQIETKIQTLNLTEKISVMPIYTKLNDFVPVISIAIYGDKKDSDLFQIAEHIKLLIEQNQEIQSVKIANPKHEKIHVIANPKKMQFHSIQAGQIYSAFEKKHLRVNQIGRINKDNKQLDVILDNKFESINEISNLTIKNLLNRDVKLSEVADIKIIGENKENKIYYDGNNAIILDIFKKDDGNLLEISKFVDETIKNIDIFDDIQVLVIQDNLIPAQKRVDDILSSLIISAIIISSVVLIYLGIQSSTVIVISMLSTFMILCLVLNLLSVKLNLFVMYSILVSLGVIIDNSIVVTEEMQKNLVKGNSVEKSYKLAIKNTFMPLLSSLATTLIAFGILFFMPTRIGQAVYFLPLTMIITLIISFIVTIFFTGTLGSIFISKSNFSPINTDRITNNYCKIIEFLFKNPILTIIKIISTVLIIASISFYLDKNDNLVFTSDIEPSKIIIQIKDDNNLPITEKLNKIEKIESNLQNYKTKITGTKSSIHNKSNSLGEVILYLPESAKHEDSDQIIHEVSEIIKQNIPEINFSITKEKYLSSASLSNNHDVNIEIYGKDYDKTLAQTKSLIKFIKNNLHDVHDLQSNINNTKNKQLKWSIDKKKILDYGTNIDLILAELVALTSDISVGKYKNHMDIIVRYDDKHKLSEMLQQNKILTKKGPVPLSTFVQETTELFPNKLSSKDGNFLFLISLNTDKIYRIKKQINNWHKINKEEDIKLSFGKIEAEENEIYDFFTKGIIFSSIAMFIILYAQFKSPIKAIIGLSSLIFIILGILIRSLIITEPFNILINSIGVMFLIGIAINNNIIIIDRYIQLRKLHLLPIDAAIESCRQRFIPIMLTSITTILSMIIPALKLSINFSKMAIEYNSPAIVWAHDMSTGIIFGMTTSTLGSLFIIPVVIAYVDIIAKNWGDESGSNRRPPEPQPGALTN